MTWANGNIDAVNLSAVLAQAAGVNQSGQTVKGASNIATSESRTNTAYGTLPTPDQVTGLVLPTNGLIRIWYQAQWSESNAGAARAAIFIGSNQLQVVAGSPTFGPGVQEASLNGGANFLAPLWTSPSKGLLSLAPTQAYAADVTTGQMIGDFSVNSGGAIDVFAAAGTYTVSVQFKATAGSVTASNRKLWVQALSFA